MVLQLDMVWLDGLGGRGVGVLQPDIIMFFYKYKEVS